MTEPLEPVDESWSTALAIVAHPDDLEYGAAAAIARWTSQGKRSTRRSSTLRTTATPTAGILPLALGLVPEADVKAVGDQLVSTILGEDGGHLDTGIFGTGYLMDALTRIGRVDVAMTVLDQTSYPGLAITTRL